MLPKVLPLVESKAKIHKILSYKVGVYILVPSELIETSADPPVQELLHVKPWTHVYVLLLKFKFAKNKLSDVESSDTKNKLWELSITAAGGNEFILFESETHIVESPALIAVILHKFIYEEPDAWAIIKTSLEASFNNTWQLGDAQERDDIRIPDWTVPSDKSITT